MDKPFITIITCTYNSSLYLRECLESVKNQSYRNFEHIFIDGESSDDTIEIINEFYKSPNIYSEKDKGVYDAFNKGLKLAKGDVIGFLHSDDVFFDKNSLERVAKSFLDKDIDYYCSKMLIYDKKLEKSFAILGKEPHKATFKDQLYSSTYFAHPTYYCKRSMVNKVGKFNLKYHIASDIDWLYRLEKVTNNYYFDKYPLIKFRGEGGTSAKKYFLGLGEEFVVRKKNESLSFSLLFIYFYHLIRRICRFILEKLGLLFVVNFFRKLIIKLAK
ncbi:glycosyltransferase [bacterium]|nr:glycosyltransferase [bacterium]